MGSTQQLKIGVIAAFAFMVLSNFLSTATKVMNNTDNAQISRENPTTLSPDGATFAIWGLIYLFEAILVVYQCFDTDTNAKVLGGNVDWAILCIVIASALAMYRAWVYCDVPYSFVTAWALGGIYRMQTYATDENFPTAAKSTDQATWALMFSLIVGAVGVVGLGKAIYRGFTTSVDDKDDASLTRSLSSSEKPASYV